MCLGAFGIVSMGSGCGGHDLRLNFAPGDTHTLVHTTERSIAMENKEGAAIDRYMARFRFDVLDVDNDGAAAMKIHIEDMAASMEVPASWGASDGAEERIAELARGRTFHLRMDRNGKVVELTDAEAIVDAITRGLLGPGVDRDKAKRMVEHQFSSTALKETFENFFAYVPDGKVRIGSEWSDVQYHSTGMPFRSNFTYTLTGIEDGIATIDCVAAIAPHNTRATIALGMNFDFSGTERATLRVAASTGWIDHYDGVYSLESMVEGVASYVEGHEIIASAE